MQHTWSLKIFPDGVGCSSSARSHLGWRGIGALGVSSGSKEHTLPADPWPSRVVLYIVCVLSVPVCFLGSWMCAVRERCRGNSSMRMYWWQKKSTGRLPFFFSFFTCLFFPPFFHFLSGRVHQQRGLPQNMSFPSCLCVQLQFPVLDPGLFSPVRRQLAWQQALRGHGGGAGGGGGPRRPPGASSAPSCLRVASGSERSCESRQGRLCWPASSQGCSQACSQTLLGHRP